MSQPARFSRGCNGPKGTFADPYRWVPHCVFGIFPHINWELRDLAGASHAVATGRVTSRGLRVGTPGPWAGRAKEAMPRGLSLRVFEGAWALLTAVFRDPCLSTGVTPWSGVPVSAAERPRPPKGGPFRQHTLGPYRVVPQRSGTEGGLKRWGFVRCPWCRHFTAAGGQPQGWGHSTRRPPLRRVPWVCPPA